MTQEPLTARLPSVPNPLTAVAQNSSSAFARFPSSTPELKLLPYREPWRFGGEFYEAMLAANRLRYSLMPYIYSEAGKVWLEDRSLIRFLAFDFPEDRNTWEITDQFLFGESLMVCPVVHPMYYDEDGTALTDVQKARRVYLPKGCDWYDFETGQKYSGGSTAVVEAPLGRIPLFVKDGSLIPMRAPALSTEEQKDEITFRRFRAIR